MYLEVAVPTLLGQVVHMVDEVFDPGRVRCGTQEAVLLGHKATNTTIQSQSAWAMF